jgi:DNA-binding response OmpR family regulator
VIRPKTILLVEDTADLLHMLTHLLELAGYSVISADSAAAAFPVLQSKTQSLDILICDRKLPDGDGVELAGLARHSNPRLQVILMSGTGMPELLGDSCSVLVKPFTGRALLERLASPQMHKMRR